jgi:hypothetical protein
MVAEIYPGRSWQMWSWQDNPPYIGNWGLPSMFITAMRDYASIPVVIWGQNDFGPWIQRWTLSPVQALEADAGNGTP